MDKQEFLQPDETPDPLEEEIRNSYAREWDEISSRPDDPKKLDYVNRKTDEVFDASDRIRAAEEKRFIDPLTGLPNLAALENAFKRISNLIEHGANLDVSFLMLDLDHFKQVNDTHGHSVGDDVLKAMAKALFGLRKTDIATRIGGEEFAILLVNPVPSKDRPNVKVLDPVELGDKLREKVTQSVALDTELFQTVSIGISTLRIDPETKKLMTLKKLKNEADIALYQSKEQGRNRVIVFKQGLTMPAKAS